MDLSRFFVNGAVSSDDDYSDSDYDSDVGGSMSKKTPSTLPWIEKYRPHKLDDVISQSNIINVFKIFIQNRSMPHMLLYGVSGVGKSSAISACARELYGEYYPFMVMELNASDERGIEVVRNRIMNFASSESVFFGKSVEDRKNIFKLVILDETDAMTNDAQAILRKVIETYTTNTRFCLICNFIQSIDPALRSRCTTFRFSPLKREDIFKRVVEVADKEGVKITDDGIETLIARSNGDMRKVLNVLQSTSMIYKVVNEKNINNCIGYPQKDQMVDILKTLTKDSYIISYNKILKIQKENGVSLNDILNSIHDIIVESILGTGSNEIISSISEDKIKSILDKIREIEYNQSVNSNDNIQLSALVGIFKL